MWKRLTAQGGGDLESLAESEQGGNLGAGEGISLSHARLEVGDLGDELHRALAGDEVVLHHAAESDHGEAAVLVNTHTQTHIHTCKHVRMHIYIYIYI